MKLVINEFGATPETTSALLVQWLRAIAHVELIHGLVMSDDPTSCGSIDVDNWEWLSADPSRAEQQRLVADLLLTVEGDLLKVELDNGGVLDNPVPGVNITKMLAPLTSNLVRGISG